MNKEKLNKLANAYVQTKCERTFNEIYAEVNTYLSLKAETIANSILADVYDVIALYEDVLIRTLQEFTEGDFANLFYLALRNARASMYRKNKLRQQYRFSETESDAPTLELASDYELEPDVIRRLTKKKEAEKRQLLDFILRAAKPDPMTTAIVDEILKDDSYAKAVNYRAIAEKLGTYDNAVKRKLRNLAKFYDEKRFGDVCDYLAV